MARVWIDDLWLKHDNGVPPSSTAKRSLAAVSDPMNAQVPERWRSSRYGKGKRWRCRWYTTEGEARRQHSKSFARLADAEAFQAGMEDDMRSGRYTDPNDARKPFQDIADMWLRSKNHVSEGVRARYECELRAYVNPRWANTPIGEEHRQGGVRRSAGLRGKGPINLHLNIQLGT